MLAENIDGLRCPKCGGALDWNVSRREGGRILTADVTCGECGAGYCVKDGIGMFLTPELQRNDLWESSRTGLEEYLSRNPDVERELLETPLEDMSPVDLHYRGVALRRRGRTEEAERASRAASEGMYGPQRDRCLKEQLDFVVSEVRRRGEPVLDLASGEGTLARRLALETDVSLTVSDFSPSVLRRDLEWFSEEEGGGGVSLMAFDARRTPFADGSIPFMTSCLGLQNIEEPGSLLKELRRVVSGIFMSVSQFYPEDDTENGKLIREYGLERLMYRDRCLEEFRRAGWSAVTVNECFAEEVPPPPGRILRGARVDALPACPTTLLWCVVIAEPA